MEFKAMKQQGIKGDRKRLVRVSIKKKRKKSCLK